MTHRLVLICSIAILGIAASARAEIEVSAPLGSYYQPGRFMPVRARIASGPAASVTLRAAGAVPTVIPAEALAGGRAVTVPFLPVSGAATELDVFADGHPPVVLPLTRVPEGERLVAVSAGEADLPFARRLFPGKRVLTVQITDFGEPSPTTWEAADAAVLDRMPDPRRVTGLLAMGVTLAVRESAAAPRDGWPWELENGYWVLRRDPAGPRGAVVPEAYDPPQMWHPGRSSAVRRGAVMGVVVFALLATGLSLLRPRWAVVAIVGGSAVACAGVLAWRRTLSPVVEANGAVLVTSDALTQRDDWIYRRHLEPADGAIAAPTADVLLKPAFASTKQLERTNLTLRAGTTQADPPQFTYHLTPGQTLAFRTTRVAPGRWPGEPTKPVRTPVRELASLYLSGETVVSGQLPDALPSKESDSVEHWPAVVIPEPSR